jgi:hypothetical protein
MKFDIEAQHVRLVATVPMRTLVLLATGLAMSAAWSSQIKGGGIGKVANAPSSQHQTAPAPVAAASVSPKQSLAGKSKAASGPQSK